MRQLIIWVATAFFSLSATAADSGITVSDARARATAPGQDSASVQLSLVSKADAKLVALGSPVAGAVEIHHMTHENGLMKMRAINFIALPAGKTVDLEKSGNHLMLLKLQHPLKTGDSVPLQLVIEFADKHTVTVDARVVVESLSENHEMPDAGDRHNMHDKK
jgi:copper(I)-binding protein